MNEIRYRPLDINDIDYVCDLDLKCHEQSPEPKKWWHVIINNPQCGCMVACDKKVPVGLVAWEKQAFKLKDFPSKQLTLHIHKICVRQEYRLRGISKQLLAYAFERARVMQCPFMSMCIPEYKVGKPGGEGDITGWVESIQFKSTIILPLKIDMYGQQFDKYLFTMKVNNE